MSCPPANAGIQTFADLKALGVTDVLSMLPVEEAVDLGMSQEADHCAAFGICFQSFPIADFGLPDRLSFASLIGDVKASLEAGKHIAIHCRAGIGRSGMVAACILIALGETAQTAVARTSQARGVSIPDTVEQGGFIASFAQAANSGLSIN